MPLIPARVWALMTPEEQAEHHGLVKEFFYTPTGNCPGCGAELQVRLSVSVKDMRLGDPSLRAPASTKPERLTIDNRTPHEVRLLAEAAEGGMLAAFEKAVLEEKQGTAPSNIGQFFLDFFRLARPVAVPRATLDIYTRRYNASIAVFQSNGVAAIVSGDIVKEFAPYSLMRTRPRQAGRLPGRLSPQPEQLERWVKGRFGYVPATSKVFSDALRESNVGGFARLVQ